MRERMAARDLMLVHLGIQRDALDEDAEGPLDLIKNYITKAMSACRGIDRTFWLLATSDVIQDEPTCTIAICYASPLDASTRPSLSITKIDVPPLDYCLPRRCPSTVPCHITNPLQGHGRRIWSPRWRSLREEARQDAASSAQCCAGGCESSQANEAVRTAPPGRCGVGVG